MNENEVYGLKITPEDMTTLYSIVEKYGFGDVIVALGLKMVSLEREAANANQIQSNNV